MTAPMTAPPCLLVEQLELPLLPGSAPGLPTPVVLAPAQIWPSLSPTLRYQVRQAVIPLLQEVVANAQP